MSELCENQGLVALETRLLPGSAVRVLRDWIQDILKSESEVVEHE